MKNLIMAVAFMAVAAPLVAVALCAFYVMNALLWAIIG